MKSYREKFQENLDKEISTFRERTLAQQAQEIYDDVYRIHFYEFMYDYLSSEEFTAKQYNSYLLSDRKDRLEVSAYILFVAKQKDIAITQKLSDVMGELTFHNLCYKLRIAPENTRSADLDYCGDTRFAVWFPSKILAVLGF